ncbi:MAG: type II toxin-antitoxin system ParD family antitoxin [Pirellulales bacterium]
MHTLLPDLETFVQQKIASGEFASREELAMEALRIYRDIEQRRAQLKSDIQVAMEEADQGLCEPLDIEAIKAELHAKIDSRGRRK